MKNRASEIGFLTGREVGLFLPWHYNCGNSNITKFKQVCKYVQGRRISGDIWGRMPSNPTGKPYSALTNDGCSEIVGYPHLNYE